ncbi:MAG: FAD-dependent oxidoreductase [Candidatus Eremiobacteraeota bacterium]|nr:FAD-dependent oxidoreductase [Candidatus Eremiobacteraeota bacterium]
MAAPRVAVVGGGLAGLAAAHALKAAGHGVELFERTRLLGGRATSFTVGTGTNRHEVDNGQHVFLGCCTAFIAFVERLGLGDALYLQERFDAVVLRGRTRSRLRAAPLPAPFHLAPSLLAYRHLPLAERIGLARILPRVREALGSQEPFDRWLARHGQSAAAIRAFWEPFVVPALNAPLDRIAAGDAAFVIATAFLSEPGAARFGWAKLPLARIAEAAARALDAVHLSTPVAALEPGPSEVGVRLGSAQGERRAFDAVVLAVPPPQLARLGFPCGDDFEARAIVDIHLWHDRGVDRDFEFAALLDAPVQWIFQKAPGYLCCSLSAADAYLGAQTAELVARAWDAVRAALPALDGATLLESAVTRNPASTFLPKTGARRPGTRTGEPNVVLAGSWLDTGWPDTMESAVRSGLAAAAALETTDALRGLQHAG